MMPRDPEAKCSMSLPKDFAFAKLATSDSLHGKQTKKPSNQQPKQIVANTAMMMMASVKPEIMNIAKEMIVKKHKEETTVVQRPKQEVVETHPIVEQQKEPPSEIEYYNLVDAIVHMELGIYDDSILNPLIDLMQSFDRLIYSLTSQENDAFIQRYEEMTTPKLLVMIIVVIKYAMSERVNRIKVIIIHSVINIERTIKKI